MQNCSERDEWDEKEKTEPNEEMHGGRGEVWWSDALPGSRQASDFLRNREAAGWVAAKPLPPERTQKNPIQLLFRSFFAWPSVMRTAVHHCPWLRSEYR